MDDTQYAGTLTVRFRPAGPSSTVVVKETTTASSTWKSVRRSALGRLEVQRDRHACYFELGNEYECELTNDMLCRFSSPEDGTMIVANSSFATGMLDFILLL